MDKKPIIPQLPLDQLPGVKERADALRAHIAAKRAERAKQQA